MNKINDLENQLEEYHKKARQIGNEIEEILTKDWYPKFEKMYVGKYFKFDNGYSADNRWFLYQKVLGITEVYGKNCRLTTIGFQTFGEKNEKIEITHNKHVSNSILGVEITKAEFMREYKKALKAITLEEVSK